MLNVENIALLNVENIAMFNVEDIIIIIRVFVKRIFMDGASSYRCANVHIPSRLQ